MRSAPFLVIALGAALTVGVFIGASLARGAETVERGDVPVKWNDVPAAVRQTAERFAEGMSLQGVVLADEDGLQVYEVRYAKGARTLQVQTTTEGALFATEERVAETELPPLVKDRVAKLFDRRVPVQLERTVTVAYEVSGRGVDGKNAEYLVNQAGTSFRELADGERR